jgi:NADH dehydrogenase
MTFKTLADVIVLRNHIIERLERADIETDAAARQRILTIVIVGGGLVGTEVFGEITAFVDEIIHYYPRIDRKEFRLYLIQAAGRIMPEVDSQLADYAMRVLRRRAGVVIRDNAPVQSIEAMKVHLKDETIEAETIVLAAGIVPSPVLGDLALKKDKHGRIAVENTLRSKDHPEVWAAGDCACVPGPDGKPYPNLAQYAMREAKTLGENIAASIEGKPLKPFVFSQLGVMAALGHEKGLGNIMGIRVKGFFAWWLRRTYYLAVMPRWAQRIRIVADWTIALFFRPDITKVDLAAEFTQMRRKGAAGMMTSAQNAENQK